MNQPVKKLSQWLEWLENTRPETDIDLGLERIHKVAESLEVLKPAPFIVTVAGTNGKGSTVALLEAMLLSAGHRVGVFTSPHFLRFNERIRINGEMVADQPLCSAFEQIDQGRGSTGLTYFEFCTLAALICFKEQPLDYVVLEVGLGGRLDATNVVDHDVSVITTIGLDHQDWLGYSLEAIGAEKAGIIRQEKPVVYGALSMPQSIARKGIELEAPLFRRGREFQAVRHDDDWFWSGQTAQGESLELNGLPLPQLELENAATALQVLQFLPDVPDRQSVEQGLVQASLPGRAQKLQWRNASGQLIDVMLDVSHNPQAVEKLAKRLEREPVSGKTHAVLAMCSDKDHVSVIDLLAPWVDGWTATAFDSPRSLSVAVLTKALERTSAEIQTAGSVKDAFISAVDNAVVGDRVLVSGSFMTVADVLAAFEQHGM
ncbi:bifunctional tetrahydrofolate synthase/dihydrofolate synthase [Endozoicomonas sp. Mp262]|uniref:bifunctional tetrahydrofolate synthase/dihydrofolate synthase n=1 Tax=Endozoicomonas sp. Mp262 TaxID=2919499 RepID=UPI0021D8A205